MATNTKIARDIQVLAPGAMVTLYEMDLTDIGGTTSYLTPHTTTSGTRVIFNGQTYTPIPCNLEGVDITSDGETPRPTFTISNVLQTMVGEISSYDDIIGGKLIRRRTFAKYLSNGSDPDGDAQFPIDEFQFERKTQQNKTFVEWEMSIPYDAESVVIPGRRALRNTCTHIYRYYKGGSFSYTNATCPYAGVSYFKRNGDVTVSASEDVCGKRLSDCVLRYDNKDDELPTRAIPGLGKSNL